MLKLWKMPDRMIHHMVGNFSTAAYGAFTAASVKAAGRAASKAPRAGSGIRSASQANSSPGMQAKRNAARQPNAAPMAPALKYARDRPAAPPNPDITSGRARPAGVSNTARHHSVPQPPRHP